VRSSSVRRCEGASIRARPTHNDVRPGFGGPKIYRSWPAPAIDEVYRSAFHHPGLKPSHQLSNAIDSALVALSQPGDCAAARSAAAFGQGGLINHLFLSASSRKSTLP